MKTAAEYRVQNAELMQEYEQRVREWLAKSDKHDIAYKVPFFRDGVTNPEVWFAEGNDFRPLFVLKEVSTGKETVNDLPDFLEIWSNIKCFEFVENPFDDIKVGSFPQWKRIAHLAKGFEGVFNNYTIIPYKTFDLDHKNGGKEYIGDIPGYNDVKYKVATANEDYLDIINKIAVLEIKKIGGGTTVDSKLSLATKYFTEHIEPFKDLLIKQIKLIEPTVVICLGRYNGDCTSELLKDIRAEYNHIPWIEGYHHQYSSNENFYYNPLMAYKEYLLSK